MYYDDHDITPHVDMWKKFTRYAAMTSAVIGVLVFIVVRIIVT